MNTELVNDRPYTMGEAAAAIGVHRNTLRRYADRRLIKRHYSRRNGRVFFYGSELRRLLTAEI
jgi:DNA-binding transcriptional MerR regulator